MSFNSDKFQMLRYRPSTVPVHLPGYIAYDGSQVRECPAVRDLGVGMTSDASFSKHIQDVVNGARDQVSWILRCFATREAGVMMTLYRALVLPRLEYCSILWSPTKAGDIQALEGVQRTYTSKISSLSHLDYYGRLKELGLYSVERRRERFAMLYVFKVIHGLVPNVNEKIMTMRHQRRGLLCVVPRVNARASPRVTDAKVSSFCHRGPALFNCLPRCVRDIADFDRFKSSVDRFLREVPDEPRAPQYHRRASSNSVDDQLAALRADGVYLRGAY